MVNAKNSPSSVSLGGQLSNDLENKRQNWNVRLGLIGRGQGWPGFTEERQIPVRSTAVFK